MVNSLLKMSSKATLLYVHDPMCSWCWGYQPTWQLLQEKLIEKLSATLDIQYCVGGLAPDTDEPMPDHMQHFLQQTWHKIAEQLGTQFNFYFWQQCQPKRSTYPACRATLVARELGKEQEMILAIQQGYYLQAKNPSEQGALIKMAAAIGLDVNAFEQALSSEKVNQQLLAEIAMVRALPINGFPSLVLAIENEYSAITVDYKHWQTSFDEIISKL